MTTLAFSRKSLSKMKGAGASAALLALFLSACQPAGQGDQAAAPASPAASQTAPAAAGADLAAFKTGEFAELDFSKELSLPTSPFLDAEGKEHTFAEYKGKVVVYNLWGEWCAPCVKEMPSLARLQEAFPKDQVVVIPIAVGTEAADAPKSVAKLKQLAGDTLPFFYDPSWKLGEEAQSGSFPSTIVYGKDGKEAARLLVPAEWDSETAKGLVQAVLDGRS